MRQRLGLAQALLGDPTFVLLDEPMNGLDPEGIEEFRTLIVSLTKDQDKTILLSSHQLNEVSGLCNRIGILRNGQLLVEAKTETLLAEGEHRLRLRTSDDPAAAALLRQKFDIEAGDASPSGLLLQARDVPVGHIARAVVERGLELQELTPLSASLEQIYLRSSRDGRAAAPLAASAPSRLPPRAGAARRTVRS